MLALENADEILQILDRFTKQKSKDIPPELEEYINYVAKTGDTVYRWPTVQYLFREKLRNVIKDFHDTTASIEDLPQCPNVDQFNYESMKTLLFERFDNFQAAPFTIQRLCELLTDPKKHYSRLDKFMRALEKNILVVSTVEPGRKPIETDENEDISYNDDLLPDINIEMELNKNDEKRSTNGITEKHNEVNTNEHVAKEVASSSGILNVSTDVEAKKEEENEKIEEQVSEKTVEPEKSTEITEEKKPNEEVAIKVTSSKDDTIETKPTEPIQPIEPIEQAIEVKEENVPAAPEEKKTNASEINADSTETVPVEPKLEAIEETPVASVDEKNIEEDTNKTLPAEGSVISEKPPTPKHARSTSDDDDDDDADADTGVKNPCAKKIRLEMDEEIPVKAKSDPEPTIEPLASDVDLQKETDILDSISTEIDAQKENELLEDVVETVLVAEKDSINIDIQPIVEKIIEPDVLKSTEEKPATENLLKSSEPVAIPTDLDFTPDEALNELVSSDILSVIPEQAAEEVKMSEESANITEPVTATDEMNVETNTENNTLEVENAMEAAPIKTDEEQMDVDESNSVDAMDL